MDTIAKIIRLFLGIFIGKFGRYTLNQPYRRIWVTVWAIVVVVLLFMYVAVPILTWWSGVVRILNYIIWG